MNRLVSLLVVLVIGLGAGFIFGSQQIEDDLDVEVAGETLSLAIEFGNHIQLELPEQDVYIEMEEGAEGEVFRVDVEEASNPDNLTKTAYASVEETHHDPFKIGDDPLGPFEKGASLNFTLEEWLNGSGSGMYAEDDGKATLELAFSSLVPESTYTLWCSRLTFPPEVAVVDLPCGALDGSENSFTTDVEGNANVTLEVKPFEESTESTVNVIAVAYHSDGNTYGAQPGPFGKDTHVQLAFIVPAPEN